jgi:DNA replication and repair protein RecF
VKILTVSLQDYRNIELARLDLDGSRAVFFYGANGQGKSNMLEALHLISSVRSFRSFSYPPLIRKGQKLARLIYRVEDPEGETSEVEMQISSQSRLLTVDGVPIRSLQDYLGRFPSVVFSNDDVQLIKTSPQYRRRYFDLVFSMVDPSYLKVLQAYHKALKERNSALKSRMSRSVVAAYDGLVAQHGVQVIQFRRSWTERLVRDFESNYAQLAPGELGELEYRPNVDPDGEQEYRGKLDQAFERDLILGSTGHGPHRDDFMLKVKSLGAKSYASDGQQRCLVLALKLAQSCLIREQLRKESILLMDDILGELDSERKARFWKLVSSNAQLFASGTELPPDLDVGIDWRVYSVANGVFDAQ